MINQFFKYLFFLVFILTIVGCGNVDIQAEALIVAEDNQITKDEFFNLQKTVVKETKFSKYKNSQELYTYLIKFFAAKKMNISVFNPNEKKVTPFAINVYFENSYSMDGYITNAELMSSIYDMLANSNKITNKIHLNYINNIIIPTPVQDQKKFSLGLTQSSFQNAGGKRGVSDIAEIVGKVLFKTNTTNLSILISDFVFSPPKPEEAFKYLNSQQTSIKADIQNKLKQQDLSIAIYQMNASFNGIYYSSTKQKGAKLNCNRPYYIWFIGTENQIKTVINKQIIDKENGSFLDFASFKSTAKKEIYLPKIITKIQGDFKITSSNSISDAIAENGEFSFNIAVNFKDDIRGLAYFDNYKIYKGSNYDISVRRLNANEQKKISLTGYTHIITLKTKSLQSEQLVVKVLNVKSQWVELSSSTDDANIWSDKSEQAKTFGLNNLISGVWQGFNFYPTAEDNVITELKINIKK